MAKKTKDQLFTEWQGEISGRHSFRKSLPAYRHLIQSLSSGQDATDELKAFVENYGPIDSYLEDVPQEEVELLGEANTGTGICVFASTWIVKPLKCAWKSSRIRGGGRGGRDKMNWDVYLDDEGFVRFAVRQNTERQIKESIESWLAILKKNKVITFNPQGNPEVKVIDSLFPKEHPGVTIRLNPFAPKERLLAKIVEVLKDNPCFTFSRRDLSHPKRIRAIRLWEEGKNYQEIAQELWPSKFKQAEKENKRKDNVIGAERTAYNDYIKELCKEGKSLGQAYKEADKKFRLKGKTPINPLIVKAYRLIH